MLTARNFKGGRTMKRLAISFLAAAALAGCAKLDSETVESTPSEGQTPFVLYVSTPSGDRQPSATKTSFNEDTYEVTWSDNDALAVTIGGKLYKFTKVKGQENAFSCSGFKPEAGVEYEYDILYPYSDNGQFATSGYVKTPMHGTAKAVGSASPNVGLEQLTGVIKVTIKNENAVGTATLTELHIERTDGGILGGPHTLAGPVAGKTAIYTEVINQNKKIEAGKSLDMYLQCAPFTAEAGSSLLVKYTVDGTEYKETKTFSRDVDFAAGKVNRTSVSFGETQYVIEGTAVPDGIQLMTLTPESDCIYAEEVYLHAGKMTISIKDHGMTSCICPADGSVEIPDNEQVDSKPAGTFYNAVVKEQAEGSELPVWNIPVEGYWRVIIDTEKNTVKFFSPKNRLEPLTFEFSYEGRNPASWILTKTLLAGNYYINAMTGWDSWKGKAFPFVASKVDPMILFWSGVSFSMTDSFCVKVAQHRADLDAIRAGEGTGGNNPYKDTGVTENDKNKDDITTTFVSKVAAFVPATAPGVASSADMELKMSEWMNTALVFSNKKWKPASTVKISKNTIDARNNKIRFD